jgi:predicted ATPase
LQETQIALAGRQIEDLLDLPNMTEPTKLAAMKILWRLLPITFTSNPLLFPLVVLKQVNLSLNYGNCASSAASYVAYGVTLQNILEIMASTYQLGKLALDLFSTI